MANTVPVRNTNPMGAVVAVDPVTGIRYPADAGKVIEVPPELAGEAPRWRRAVPGQEDMARTEWRTRAGHIEVYDLGSGLLAQVGNWEVPEPPADPPAADPAAGTNDKDGGAK